MPSGCWIKLKKEQVVSSESVYRGNMPLCGLSTNFGKSNFTTAYQTFLFVPDSVKLGRACSSDVYSALRTKAKFYYRLSYSREPLIVILVYTHP